MKFHAFLFVLLICTCDNLFSQNNISFYKKEIEKGITKCNKRNDLEINIYYIDKNDTIKKNIKNDTVTFKNINLSEDTYFIITIRNRNKLYTSKILSIEFQRISINKEQIIILFSISRIDDYFRIVISGGYEILTTFARLKCN